MHTAPRPVPVTDDPEGQVILHAAGEGRAYDMGLLQAVFKVDEAETGARYSVSEWTVHPGFEGVGPHLHEANDELFFVLSGTPELLAGDQWQSHAPGAFLRIPAGVTHDFRNRTNAPASLLNIFLPGGFERDMPAIVQWFAQNR